MFICKALVLGSCVGLGWGGYFVLCGTHCILFCALVLGLLVIDIPINLKFLLYKIYSNANNKRE